MDDDQGGPARIAAIDRVRGLAIMLMVLDHVLAGTGELEVVRYTVTRASLPLFMLVAGSLLASRGRDGPSVLRLLQLGAAAWWSLILVEFMPFMARVDVLLVFLVALLAWPVARRWPVATAAASFAAVATMPVMWDGYHVAELVGLMSLGALPGVYRSLQRAGDVLPRCLEWPGRFPLLVYVGHLAVLFFVCGGVR